MSSPATKKPKGKAGYDRKRSNHLGHTARVETANVANARRVASTKKSTPRGDTDRAHMSSRSSGPLNDNAPMSSMFGDNTEVSGGQFIIAETVHNNVKSSGAEIAFERLLKRVATAAFHNSAQRVDPPRCHPDTREEILKRIYDWIMQSEDREKWLLWLNGAAGAGKSAIMQSTAERCAIADIAIASFFFFRDDSTRNTMAHFVSTLAYQLMRAIPETAGDVLRAIKRDPLIFDQSLKYQLQHLIIKPLLRLPRELQRLFVVLIDGLDECNDQIQQSNLIKTFSDLSSGKNIPVVFVIASRREPQIEAEFIQKSVSDLLFTLPLDNSDVEHTSDDIRRFLTDRFKNIRETHLHRRLIPQNWPPLPVIDEIVAKSSGQFIFASVVINYISSVRKIPTRQLEFVRDIGLREASSQNPFVHLDALYQHIFSQVDDLDMVLNILALALIAGRSQVASFEQTFRLGSGELKVHLADLAAVISCEEAKDGIERVKFLHASLPDFLLDRSRAGNYYIDSDVYKTKLLYLLLEKPPPILDSLSSTHNLQAIIKLEHERLDAIRVLLYYGDNGQKPNIKASKQLRTAFMRFNFTFFSEKVIIQRYHETAYTEILKFFVYNLDDNWHAVYDHVLDMFSVGYARLKPSISFDTAVKTFKLLVNNEAHHWKLRWIYDNQSDVSPGSICGFSCKCLLGICEDVMFDTSSGRAAYIYHNPDPNSPSHAGGPRRSRGWSSDGRYQSTSILPRLHHNNDMFTIGIGPDWLTFDGCRPMSYCA